MRYTKSGKEILSFWENIRKETQEVKAAQKAVSMQISQLNRKLYYFPLAWFIIKVAFVSAILFGIVRFSGYVTGQAEEKPQPVYTCPVAHCSVLPETGAN